MDFAKEKEMRPIVEKWLRDRGYDVVHEIRLSGYCDVIGLRFAERTSHRIPPLERMVAVELKLRDIAGVRWQAKTNRYYAHESYAAMPADFCGKMRDKTEASFLDIGVGLLAVGYESVEVVVRPTYVNDLGELSLQFSKKMWRALQRQKKYKRGELGGPDV